MPPAKRCEICKKFYGYTIDDYGTCQRCQLTKRREDDYPLITSIVDTAADVVSAVIDFVADVTDYSGDGGDFSGGGSSGEY